MAPRRAVENMCAEEMAKAAEAPADGAQADAANGSAGAEREEKPAEQSRAEEPLVDSAVLDESAKAAEALADGAQADDANDDAKAASEEKPAEDFRTEEPRVESEALEETAKAAEAQADDANGDAKDDLQNDAKATGEAQSMEESQVRPEVPEVSEQPKGPEMPQASSSSKRKRASGGTKAAPSLEAMASKIKQFQEDANKTRALLKEKEAELKEKEAEIAGLRAEAEAKDAAAHRAAQDYVKKQTEAALAQLDSCIPKRPPNTFCLYCLEVRVKGNQASQLWNKMSDEEKKKYRDLHKELDKKFQEWGNSEEGQKNIRERQEILRNSKAHGKEELEKAVGALGSQEDEIAWASPSKRTAAVPAGETPAKHRRTEAAKAAPPAMELDEKDEKVTKRSRVSSGKVSTAAAVLVLDEEVLEEATKVDLDRQLRNLAGRPDVCALGKSSQELLDALRAHNGMVNATKHSLLSVLES